MNRPPLTEAQLQALLSQTAPETGIKYEPGYNPIVGQSRPPVIPDIQKPPPAVKPIYEPSPTLASKRIEPLNSRAYFQKRLPPITVTNLPVGKIETNTGAKLPGLIPIQHPTRPVTGKAAPVEVPLPQVPMTVRTIPLPIQTTTVAPVAPISTDVCKDIVFSKLNPNRAKPGDYTLPELKTIANGLGIPSPSSLNKKALVQAIKDRCFPGQN